MWSELKGAIVVGKYLSPKTQKWYIEISERLRNGELSRLSFSCDSMDLSKLPANVPVDLGIEVQGISVKGNNFFNLIDIQVLKK